MIAKVHQLESETIEGIRDTSGQDVVIARAGQSKRIVIIVAGVLLALFAVIIAKPALERWLSGDKAVSRERLRIATVSRGSFTRDIAVQGTVVAAVSPTIFAPSAGTVTLHVNAGDQVNQGDRLATIDSPQLANGLLQEQATLDSLETNLQRQTIENRKASLVNQQNADLATVALAATERELRRAEVSWDRKLVSLQDLEKARDDVQRAKIESDHAQRAAKLEDESLDFELKTLKLQRDRQQLMVANLQRQMEELTLRSPVHGVVGTLAVDQRAAVTSNAALLTVVDLSAFEVDARVPESYGDDLLIGMDASLSFATQSYPARVTAISPEINSGTVSVRLSFVDTTPAGLRQNQRLSGRVLLEHKADALTIARGAFLDSGGRRIAYLIDQDVAHRVPIQVGASSISTVEILAGLQAGDQIIISDIEAFGGAETILLND